MTHTHQYIPSVSEESYVAKKTAYEKGSHCPRAQRVWRAPARLWEQADRLRPQQASPRWAQVPRAQAAAPIHYSQST